MNIKNLKLLRDALIKQQEDAPHTYDQNRRGVDCECAINTSDNIFPNESGNCRDIYDVSNWKYEYIFGTRENITITADTEEWPLSSTWTAKDAADRIDFLLNTLTKE